MRHGVKEFYMRGAGEKKLQEKIGRIEEIRVTWQGVRTYASGTAGESGLEHRIAANGCIAGRNWK